MPGIPPGRLYLRMVSAAVVGADPARSRVCDHRRERGRRGMLGEQPRLDGERYARLAAALVEHGIWVASRGVWYVSASHGDAELDAMLTRFDHALAAWR
jgi:hypothetical protein